LKRESPEGCRINGYWRHIAEAAAVTEMDIRLIRAIDDRGESLAAFQLLKENLRKDSQVFPDHLIGWQGGSRRHTAYWLPKLGVWAVLEPFPPRVKKGPGHRFWNCFGIGDPVEQKTLTITVEINPPHEGEDRRVAGLFARDADNHIYIAHTGKIGGGRTGIGPKAFREFLRDHRWHEIETQGERRMAVVLGPIDARDFPNQLGDFVHKVADFKERAVRRSASG
jgi:hypothetical protein